MKGDSKNLEDNIVCILCAKQPHIYVVRPFLGLALHCSKFISDASTLLHRLYQLLWKDSKFQWTTECQVALQKIQVELTSEEF